MLRHAVVLAITLGLTGVAGQALAHVAPSVDDNNRYLKLTPLGDRVRLAYTVFFGEVPGGQTRPSIDTNHDGTISDAEAQTFGTKVAAEVAAALELSVDGIQATPRWAEVAVGMGTPTVKAGSFSIDLISYLCFTTARGRHVVKLRDRFRLPRPGETEVKVDDIPGITIEHARIGQTTDPGHEFRFVGPGGPLSDDGLDLAFTASAKAPLGDAALCSAAAEPATRSMPTGLIVGVAGVLGFGVAVVITLVRRRRAQR